MMTMDIWKFTSITCGSIGCPTTQLATSRNSSLQFISDQHHGVGDVGDDDYDDLKNLPGDTIILLIQEEHGPL